MTQPSQTPQQKPSLLGRIFQKRWRLEIGLSLTWLPELISRLPSLKKSSRVVIQSLRIYLEPLARLWAWVKRSTLILIYLTDIGRSRSLSPYRETRVPKNEWGAGPWQNEDDEQYWVDATTGYLCMFLRSEITGCLNGYVGVPFTHKAFLAQYEDAELEEISVHGGLTYSGFFAFMHKMRPPAGYEGLGVWWLGFDTAHSGDKCPAMDALLERISWRSLFANTTKQADFESYKTQAYIEQETQQLAAQLAVLGKAPIHRIAHNLWFCLIVSTNWYARLRSYWKLVKLRWSMVKFYELSKKSTESVPFPDPVKAWADAKRHINALRKRVKP